MTVYSMTGYASVTVAVPSKQAPQAPPSTVCVELRSVNGRFLDLSLKLPEEVRALEPKVRELIAAHVRRGKVELRLFVRDDDREQGYGVSAAQIDQVERLQSAVRGRLPDARALSVHEILTWCRVAPEPPAMSPDDAANAVMQCVRALQLARQREGEKLAATLRDRLAQLQLLADRARPLVPVVVERQRQRFLQRWAEATAAPVAGTGLEQTAWPERAMQEATAFALRIDVAEELDRLVAHLSEIAQLLQQGGELGKRLDFLIQELHREANTLGSKSAALEMTGISVEMRVLIEQMREMVQNIE